MQHVGIDMGLSVTAIVVLDDEGKIIAKTQFGASLNDPLKLARKGHRAERYLLYYKRMCQFLTQHVDTKNARIVMEDPQGHMVGNGLKLIELKGVYLICLALHIPIHNIFLPTATQIKKSFTGNGSAVKIDMIEECKKRGHMPANDHEADAIGMAYMSIEGVL